MKFKRLVAQGIALSTKQALNIAKKNGSSLPGKLAMQIDKSIPDGLGANQRLIMVSGTNGKTMTTALIVQILKAQGYDVFTNASGANMLQGVVTTLMLNRKAGMVGVLEVDEATLPNLCAYVKPETFVFTNLFADQTDRYGSEKNVLHHLEKATAMAPEATIVYNGDLPLFSQAQWKNTALPFGFAEGAVEEQTEAHIACPECGAELHYSVHPYAELGGYRCPSCTTARPLLHAAVEKVAAFSPTMSEFVISDKAYRIPVGGLYNIYNALAAYTVGKLWQVSDEVIQKGYDSLSAIAGRQEQREIAGHRLVLNLTKNPVGFDQIVDMLALENEPVSVAVFLNNAPADGVDYTWINDANFEKLVSLAKGPILYGGVQKEALNARLEQAGAPLENRIMLQEVKDLKEGLKLLPAEKVYILATFTAMNDVHDALA